MDVIEERYLRVVPVQNVTADVGIAQPLSSVTVSQPRSRNAVARRPVPLNNSSMRIFPYRRGRLR